MRCEQQSGLLVGGAERILGPGVEVQRAQVAFLHVQLERQNGQHPEVGGAGGESGPPALGAQIVCADGDPVPRRTEARTLPRILLPS